MESKHNYVIQLLKYMDASISILIVASASAERHLLSTIIYG
jgi:hypothetical protein